MILIADGGSTKCDWAFYKVSDKIPVHSFQTIGLNPTYIEGTEIRKLLKDDPCIASIADKVEEVFFFGSGCGNQLYRNHMKQILEERFKAASIVRVFGDIEGAAFACTDQPGVVGILGTGSNICYFDGNRIHLRIPSLGYTIMDQGSGNHMGRELLKAFYFGQFSSYINDLLTSNFNLDVDYVKKRLYSSDGASSYLASFADFLIQKGEEPEFSAIIHKSLSEFFNLSIHPFHEELKTVPLHLVGSIAHYTRNYIDRICDQRGIKLGNVVQRPINRIIENIEAIRKYCHESG